MTVGSIGRPPPFDRAMENLLTVACMSRLCLSGKMSYLASRLGARTVEGYVMFHSGKGPTHIASQMFCRQHIVYHTKQYPILSESMPYRLGMCTGTLVRVVRITNIVLSYRPAETTSIADRSSLAGRSSYRRQSVRTPFRGAGGSAACIDSLLRLLYASSTLADVGWYRST